MNKALILIDIQNDYFSGGSMALENMDNVAQKCNQLLTHFRKDSFPIVHIQHVSTRAGATFFLPNTYGCEINELVKPENNEPVVIKHYPSSFRETELEALLKAKGINELVICGAMTHMCIDTTTRAAFDLGFNCTVASDACATKALEFDDKKVSATEVNTAFLAALSSPFANILTTDAIVGI